MTKADANQGIAKCEEIKIEGNMHITEVGAFKGMKIVAGSLARHK